MITYEPPEQQEVNVGDHIEGIGTVADPDDLKVTELPQRPAVEGNRGGRPMTVTETLRAMLDDRGVKWHNRDSESGHDDCLVFKTWWKGNLLYEELYPNGDSYTLLEARAVEHITPEQAVEATLGRGTCRVIATKKLGDLFGYRLSCGHSMVNPFDDHPDYCPWCGAKVVEPTTNDVDAEVGE